MTPCDATVKYDSQILGSGFPLDRLVVYPEMGWVVSFPAEADGFGLRLVDVQAPFGVPGGEFWKQVSYSFLTAIEDFRGGDQRHVVSVERCEDVLRFGHVVAVQVEEKRGESRPLGHAGFYLLP